jgi:hypothetical protein
MTLDQQIEQTRSLLDFAQKFRQGVEELTEGAAKPVLIAQADATVAKIASALHDLEALASVNTATLQ